MKGSILMVDDDASLCEVFDRCHAVSEFLLDRSPIWLDETY